MTIQELEDTLVSSGCRGSSRIRSSACAWTAFRSKRAYIEGEVRSPGLQVFTDIPMTLAEAINRAGGFAPNGDRSAVNLTRDGKTTAARPDGHGRGGHRPDAASR